MHIHCLGVAEIPCTTFNFYSLWLFLLFWKYDFKASSTLKEVSVRFLKFRMPIQDPDCHLRYSFNHIGNIGVFTRNFIKMHTY